MRIKQVGLPLYFFFTFVTACTQALAETYYIDAVNGDDNNPGTWDTNTNTPLAWQSLVRAFDYSTSPGFNAGDSILLKRGQEHYAGNAEGGTAATWLVIFTSSGAPGQPIVFDAYGEVEYDAEGNDINRPVVRMRVSKALDSEWVPSTTPGVWQLNRSTFSTTGMFEDDLPLKKCADETCSDGGNWYHYNESCSGCIHWNTLYYRPTSGTPADHAVHFSRWGNAAFDNVSHIRVSNLEFRTTHRPLRFRSKLADVSDITVENCIFHAAEFGPSFDVAPGSPGTVNNVRILNNYSRYVMRAVSLTSQANPNGIHDAEIAYNVSDDANAHGVWTGDPELFYFQRMNNSHIHHNRVNGGYNTGLAMWTTNDGISTGNLIEHNFVQNVHGRNGFQARGWYLGSGAVVDTCFANTIRYNVIINSDIGMVPANCSVSSQSPNLLYNNTLVGNGTNLLYRNGARRWEIKNNIIASPQATANVPVPVQVDHESADNDFVSQHNLYYPTTGLLFRYTGTEISWGDWLTTSQQDATSIAADPLFANAANDDYRLATVLSPAVDAGEYLGQGFDIEGNPVDTMPDIGAYEIVDADGDGFGNAVDCDDNDPASYPGAIEIPLDGTDQDCQGGDSTITVLKASYSSRKGGQLVVEAVSANGQNDPLSVVGYDPMQWSKKQGGRWVLKQTGIGANPGTVRMTGAEGTIEVSL